MNDLNNKFWCQIESFNSSNNQLFFVDDRKFDLERKRKFYLL